MRSSYAAFLLVEDTKKDGEKKDSEKKEEDEEEDEEFSDDSWDADEEFKKMFPKRKKLRR